MGGGYSKSLATIMNELKTSIDSVQKSMVNTNTNVSCQNVQEVVGTSGCNINFAPQTCDLEAVTKSTSSQQFMNSASQDVLQSLKQMSSATTSGLQVGVNISESSAYIKSLMSVAQASTQVLSTECTKNASGINIQSVRDSSCTDQNTINFAAQNTSTKLQSECVVNVMASNSAVQKVTNLMDQSATATTKGVDLFSMLAIAGLAFILILCAPMIKKMITGNTSAVPLPDNTPTEVRMDIEKRDNQRKAFFYIIIILLVLLLLWYPGFTAGILGITPWPAKTSNEYNSFCTEGEDGTGTVAESSIINKFGFVDPICVSTRTNDGSSKSCKTIVSYSDCGIMSNKCDDPVYIKDRTDYENAVNACGGLIDAPFRYCRSQDINNALFAPEKPGYSGCKRCINDSSNPLWHSYVAKDKECDETKINLFYYWGAEGCEAGSELGYCLDTKEALLAKSPNDCMDPGYQWRKAQLSRYLRACKAVELTSREKSLLIKDRCPPSIFQFLTKCTKSDETCSYTAKGCVCDNTGKNCDCKNANPSAVGACQNNFTNCTNSEYVMDVRAHSKFNAECKKVRGQQNSTNFVVPVFSGVVYGILFLVGIIMFILSMLPPANQATRIAMETRKAQLKQLSASQPPVMSNTALFICFLVSVILLFCFIPPLGVLGVVNKSAPLYDGDKLKGSQLLEGADVPDTSMITTGYIGATLCALAIIVFFLLLLKRLFQKPQPSTSAATQ